MSVDNNPVDSLIAPVKSAQKILEEYDQEQIDKIIYNIVKTIVPLAGELALMAHEETGFGRPEDKKIKNEVASRDLYEYIKDMKTVGVIRSFEQERIAEIAAPVGIVLAIIPSTNPTSTTIFKALISLKSRNGVVFSPHPSAAGCINHTADIIHRAAVEAGAPEGIIACVQKPTMDITAELMKHRDVSMILATGGMGLVRAAYSSGKPAYGVGPGNVPAYIDRSADVEEAVRCVLTGKTFDWGTVCSSEQSIVADAPVYDEVISQLRKRSAHICTDVEIKALEKTVVRDNYAVNPEVVGKSPVFIAEKAGFKVSDDTTALVCPYEGIGKGHPLSIEKLSPVLTLYKANGWEDGCAKCIKILKFGGLGHSLSIHCADPEIIKQFGLYKPASRILVNTSSTHGAIGNTTNLPPSLTLGCGPLGGNITSDNITPLHLVTIKRLAYGVVPPESTLPQLKKTTTESATPIAESENTGVDKNRIGRIVDEFIEGKLTPGRPVERTAVGITKSAAETEKVGTEAVVEPEENISSFVDEKDVQKAMYSNRKIKVTKDSIITPLAKELGDRHKIFILV